jgi:hypothetical protein
MRATRVSLSLLSQAVITSILAWLFLDEKLQLICYWWFNSYRNPNHFLHEYTLDKNTKEQVSLELKK